MWGCFNLDKRKDDPNLPQIKAMIADLDPIGMPVATSVFSGQTADDGLYPSFITLGGGKALRRSIREPSWELVDALNQAYKAALQVRNLKYFEPRLD